MRLGRITTIILSGISALLSSHLGRTQGSTTYATSIPSAAFVTLSGTISQSNGIPAANYTLAFRPTQSLLVGATGLVLGNTTNCSTDANGAVVGIANPSGSPLLNAAFTGLLPAGNYFVKIAWQDAAGHTTAVGNEAQVQLSAQGGITVKPPSTGYPAGVNSMAVYVSITSGTETLQGATQARGAVYSISTPLVSGTAAPASNATLCQQVANDAMLPIAGYTVSLISPGGNAMPGYPQRWQLIGPGSVINLGNGVPIWTGAVQFQSGPNVGPPGCLNAPPPNGTCTDALTPTSVTSKTINHILYEGAWQGSDLGARVAAAFASVAGTLQNPTPSATVYCSPGMHYYTVNPVELPGPTTFPFITAPTVDCMNDTITKTVGADGPTVLIHGRNVGTAAESAILRNAIVENRNTMNSPAILDQDSMGQVLDHVSIYSNQDAYAVKLGTYDGGPGFREQGRMFNVAFEACGLDAIHVYSADGQPWGYQYNYGSDLRFQMDGNCRRQMDFDHIGNVFNNHYQGTNNSSGSSPMFLMYSTSTVASTYLEINGENNGSPWSIGGGAVIDLDCRHLARAGFIAFDPRASCHSDYTMDPSGKLGVVVRTTEEGGPQARNSQWGLFPNLADFRIASNIGSENNNGQWGVQVCKTDSTYMNVGLSPNCRNLMFANPSYNGEVGIGFGRKFTFGAALAEAPIHIGYDAGNAGAGGEGLMIENVGTNHESIIGFRPRTGVTTFRFAVTDTAAFFYNVARGTWPLSISATDDTVMLPSLAGTGCRTVAAKADGTLYATTTVATCP